MSAGLRVRLQLATPRAALDSPAVRLVALAHRALTLAGADVVLGEQDGVPAKPAQDALSWALEHDLLLRDLTGPSVPLEPAPGPAFVASPDPLAVASAAPGGADQTAPVLWVAPDRPSSGPPSAALTLTPSDAARLAGLGVRAVALLAWPRPAALPAAPRRIVLASSQDTDAELLDDVVDHLSAGLPGRARLDVIPDAPVLVGGRRHAPLHPWQRSRLVRACDAVLVLGRSAATDLLVAEASLAGAGGFLITPGRPDGAARSTGPLAAALPAGLQLTALEPSGVADRLGLRTTALAGWLGEMSAAAAKES